MDKIITKDNVIDLGTKILEVLMFNRFQNKNGMELKHEKEIGNVSFNFIKGKYKEYDITVNAFITNGWIIDLMVLIGDNDEYHNISCMVNAITNVAVIKSPEYKHYEEVIIYDVKKQKLVLEYIGEDNFNRPVYRTKDGKSRLFKDINCGSGEMELCSSSNNEIDGEPCDLISEIDEYKNLVIETLKPEPIVTKEERFNYQLLGRLKMDCEYYLNYGNRDVSRLWAKTEQEHIDKMKELYNDFDDNKKPEWLTWEDILNYEQLMITKEGNNGND